ncbi:hypothetical protein D9M71_488310 [compost metagenome]
MTVKSPDSNSPPCSWSKAPSEDLPVPWPPAMAKVLPCRRAITACKHRWPAISIIRWHVARSSLRHSPSSMSTSQQMTVRRSSGKSRICRSPRAVRRSIRQPFVVSGAMPWLGSAREAARCRALRSSQPRAPMTSIFPKRKFRITASARWSPRRVSVTRIMSPLPYPGATRTDLGPLVARAALDSAA